MNSRELCLVLHRGLTEASRQLGPFGVAHMQDVIAALLIMTLAWCGERETRREEARHAAAAHACPAAHACAHLGREQPYRPSVPRARR